MKKTTLRIICGVCLYIALGVCPWWLCAIILSALIMYMPLYLEALVFAFIYDSAYTSTTSFLFSLLTYTTIFLVLVVYAKTQIRR